MEGPILDRLRAVVPAALVIILAACPKNPTPAEQEAETRQSYVKRVGDIKYRGAGFTVAPVTPPAPPTTPGPAFLYMTDVGVLKLDVTGTPSLIEARLGEVEGMVATPAGDLYLLARSEAGESGVWKLAAGATAFTSIGDGKSRSGKLGLGPDGAIWLVSSSEVATWTGSAWKPLPGKPALDDEQYPSSFVIDGANKPYVSTARTIMVFDGTAWKPVWDIRDLYIDGMIAMPDYPALMIGPGNTLVAGFGSGTLTFDGKDMKISLRPLRAKKLAGKMTLHGTELVAAATQWIVRTPLAGGEDRVIEPTTSAPLSHAAVFDTAGRVWMSLENGGFTVVDATNTAAFIPPGGLPDLIAEVTAIAVAGAGPTSLPKIVEIATGTIRGVIHRAGTPIAKARVEVCRRLATKFTKGDTPCTYSRSKSRGETDASGAFQLDDLPLLDYGVAVEVDGQWYGIRGKACGEGLAPGAICDLGPLDISTARAD